MHYGIVGHQLGDLDIILGQDVKLNDFPKLEIMDRERVVVSQSQIHDGGIYSGACTMMSTYGAILSNVNGKEDPKLKRQIIDDAVAEGYKTHFGRDFRTGVARAVKTRNAHNPRQQQMYSRTDLLSNAFLEFQEKGYPTIVGTNESREYNFDKKDGVIDQCYEGVEFGKGGHALAIYEGNLHIDTYPEYPNNIYKVNDFQKLVRQGAYGQRGYTILPAKGYNHIMERKIEKAIIKLLPVAFALSRDPKYNKALDILK